MAPSVPSRPLLPRPTRTRPIGSTPGPSVVNPLWFSNPTSSPHRLSTTTLPMNRSGPAMLVAGDGDLLLILATAPKEAIDVERDRFSHADLLHLDRDAAPLGTPPQGDH